MGGGVQGSGLGCDSPISGGVRDQAAESSLAEGLAEGPRPNCPLPPLETLSRGVPFH